MDTRQVQVSHEQRDGNPRMTHKERPGIKHTVEMKDAFDRLIGRLDGAGERIAGLEDIAVESWKIKKQRE